MNGRDEAYWLEMRQSFLNLLPDETIPVSSDGKTVVVLGYQTLGITSKPVKGGNLIGITDYDLPGAFEGFASVNEKQILVRGRWVHGAKHGVEQRRGGFPDIPPASQANRMCSVNFGSEGLWFNRGDRDFFVIRPPVVSEENTWRTIRKVSLPNFAGSGYRSVASALLRADELVTIETDTVPRFFLVRYDRNRDDIFLQRSCSALPQWRYGVALARKDGKEGAVTVTAYQTDEPPGIYFGDELIVPEVYGTGLAPLGRGAVVCAYGREKKSSALRKGVPGSLIFISDYLLPGIEWFR